MRINALEAIQWLLDHGDSGAPVVDDAGHLKGVFTEHDSVAAPLDALAEDRPVGDVGAYMSREVERVSPDARLVDVARLFTNGRHRRLLVTDEQNRLLGLVARRDLLRGLWHRLSNKHPPSTYDVLGSGAECSAELRERALGESDAGDWATARASWHNPDPVLEAANISVCVGERRLFRELSFQLPAGQTLALMGPTGSGKSSLLRAIAWLRPLCGGQLSLHGKSVQAWGVSEWRRRVVYVPQHPPPLRASAAHFLSDISKLRVHREREPETWPASALELTEAWGLSAETWQQDFSQLSGGERQRLYLALVLVTRPEVLLLDEPTSALDRQTKLQIEATLSALQDADRHAALWVTHDPEQADRVAGSRLELGA